MSARQIFIEDPATNRIRFTKAGRDRYAARFARAGYRIDDLRTKAALQAAADAVFRLELSRLADICRGQDPALDAVLSGLPGWEDA